MKMMIHTTSMLRDQLFPSYKCGLVLGDMRELGSYSAEAHEQLVVSILESDFVFTV
jgi:UDP-N-acetylmuramyl pentapeptide synthase